MPDLLRTAASSSKTARPRLVNGCYHSTGSSPPPAPWRLRGRKPFQPSPFMFQATLPPSCSVQICTTDPHTECSGHRREVGGAERVSRWCEQAAQEQRGFTSSEQVHQDGFSGSLARPMTRASGLRLPCGECSFPAVEMPSQHTKWWLPAGCIRQNATGRTQRSASPSADTSAIVV